MVHSTVSDGSSICGVSTDGFSICDADDDGDDATCGFSDAHGVLLPVMMKG